MGFFDGIGGAMTGGVLSYLGQEETNRSNAQMAQSAQQASAREAQSSRDWQEHMSNTSYQRAVKDMQSAGLNPMLAYQSGGASSPSGATGLGFQAQMGNSLASAVEGFNRSRSTGAEVEQKSAQTEQSGSQTSLNKAAEAKVEADTKVSEATAKQVEASTLAKIQEARTGSAVEARERAQAASIQDQRARDSATAPLYNILERATQYIKDKAKEVSSASHAVRFGRKENPRSITIYGDSK